jgi:hypothetical protein
VGGVGVVLGRLCCLGSELDGGADEDSKNSGLYNNNNNNNNNNNIVNAK